MRLGYPKLVGTVSNEGHPGDGVLENAAIGGSVVGSGAPWPWRALLAAATALGILDYGGVPAGASAWYGRNTIMPMRLSRSRTAL